MAADMKQALVVRWAMFLLVIGMIVLTKDAKWLPVPLPGWAEWTEFPEWTKLPDLPKWVGFEEDKIVSTIEERNGQGDITKTVTTTTPRPSKTLWDWLGLLGVPLSLVVLGFKFQQLQREQATEQAELERSRAEEQAKREREIAEDNQLEEVLQAYFDRLSELLVNKNLIAIATKKNITDEEIALVNAATDVIQARTLTILTRLRKSQSRKTTIIRFLSDTNIINGLGPELAGADLSGLDLSGINLKGINLKDVNFSNSNLNNVDLSGSILTNANFTAADLTQASLHHANLFNAKLYSSKLIGADLSHSLLINTSLVDADLRRASLFNTGLAAATGLSTSNFKGAFYAPNTALPRDLDPSESGMVLIEPGVDLCGANLRSVRLRDVDLSGADLFYADLTGTDLRGTNFSNAKLKAARFYLARLDGVNFTDADLSLSHFRSVVLSGVNLDNADLSGADLDHADLRNVQNWTEKQIGLAKLCKTKLPEGCSLDPNRDCEK